jgi:FKBP-type peptidyl-prolyl cis-trans isomerase
MRMLWSLPSWLVLVLCLGVAGCDAEEEGMVDKEVYAEGKKVTLKYKDLVVGTGPAVKAGDRVEVYYTGKLKNGTKFDSNVGKAPFPVTVGIGEVIKGWDEGLVGMKEGGKRKLVIPPELGYGAKGAGKTIPPNAELHFEVELVKVVQ